MFIFNYILLSIIWRKHPFLTFCFVLVWDLCDVTEGISLHRASSFQSFGLYEVKFVRVWKRQESCFHSFQELQPQSQEEAGLASTGLKGEELKHFVSDRFSSSPLRLSTDWPTSGSLQRSRSCEITQLQSHRSLFQPQLRLITSSLSDIY